MILFTFPMFHCSVSYHRLTFGLLTVDVKCYIYILELPNTYWYWDWVLGYWVGFWRIGIGYWVSILRYRVMSLYSELIRILLKLRILDLLLDNGRFWFFARHRLSNLKGHSLIFKPKRLSLSEEHAKQQLWSDFFVNKRCFLTYCVLCWVLDIGFFDVLGSSKLCMYIYIYQFSYPYNFEFANQYAYIIIFR
jgi:hypothetical protein